MSGDRSDQTHAGQLEIDPEGPIFKNSVSETRDFGRIFPGAEDPSDDEICQKRFPDQSLGVDPRFLSQAKV